MGESEKIFEIRDPEVNVEEIMSRIRERIRQRRTQAQEKGLDYDRLVDDGELEKSPGRLSPDLYYDLHQLRSNTDSILVSLTMRDRRFLLLNSPLFRIEKLLHRLVVKYVNLLAGRQIAFNRTSVNVLSGFAHVLEGNDNRLEQLEKQVAELRERLAKLEKAS